MEPIQPRRPPSGGYPLRELSTRLPVRYEPLLRTRDPRKWDPSTFHVKRRAISMFGHRAPSRSRLCAQIHASSIGSTPAPPRPTRVTSTTTEVPAHVDTWSRRPAPVQRTSPPGRGERGRAAGCSDLNTPLDASTSESGRLRRRRWHQTDHPRPAERWFSQHFSQHRPTGGHESSDGRAPVSL